MDGAEAWCGTESSQALSRLTPTVNGSLAFSPGSDQPSAVESAPALLGDEGSNVLPSGLWTLPTGHPGPVVVAGGAGGSSQSLRETWNGVTLDIRMRMREFLLELTLI